MTKVETDEFSYEDMMARERINSSLVRENHIKAVKTIGEFIVDGKQISLIDFGASDGSLLNLVRDNYGTSIDSTAADVSELALEHMRKLGFKTVKFDAEDSQTFQKQFSNKFDFATCLESIEHVVDSDCYLNIINRSLKNTGKLFLTTPNIMGFKYWLHNIRGGIPWKEGHHVRFWNYARIMHYATMSGFRLVNEKHLTYGRFQSRGIATMAVIFEVINSRKGFHSFSKNWPILNFGMLFEKDPDFLPIGVLFAQKRQPLYVNKKTREHMLRVIQTVLVENQVVQEDWLRKISDLLKVSDGSL